MPREAGYCFNPICVYLCWKDEARSSVEFVVTEVSNTPWNQRTVHVLPLSEGVLVDGEIHLERVKSLHVSPFNAEPDGQATWVRGACVFCRGLAHSCTCLALPLQAAQRKAKHPRLAIFFGGGAVH